MAGLSEADVHPDPMVQLIHWRRDAAAGADDGADEMVVATVGADGTPGVRMVLLRGLDPRGLVFYTNYQSPKARAIEAGAPVALLLRWRPLRQVRVVGRAARVGAEESDAYWAQRPRESRLSAAASPQSQVVSRAALARAVEELRAQVGDGPVPRPPHWGGYRVHPFEVELWQQGAHRLHDRLRYRLVGGRWLLERLAP